VLQVEPAFQPLTYTDHVKGLRFVIGFLLVATIISVGAMLLLYVVVSQEPDVPAHATLVLEPSGDLPEVLPELMLAGGDDLTVRNYLELIRKASAAVDIPIIASLNGVTQQGWTSFA